MRLAKNTPSTAYRRRDPLFPTEDALQPISTGVLAAGTLIRNLDSTANPHTGAVVSSYEASDDGGETWIPQRTPGRIEVVK